ncbi:unnamed protein product [Boreogadus saida]
MEKEYSVVFLLLMLSIPPVGSWHDLDNSEYDCWPLDEPNQYNMIDCGGLEMSWIVRPPEEVKSGQVFSVTYTVTAHDAFYDWAIKKDVFPHSSIVDAEAARWFCEHQDCPTNWRDADGENCCIHHANIHSCPIRHLATYRICGPWIPDDGNIFTHTISTSGTMAQTNWTSKVVLVHAGLTSLIAHIRVGRMQVALEAKSTVLPPLADCGECPLTLGTKLAIGLPVSLVCLCFIMTAVWLMYQKQKLLWDESWIIDFTLIQQQAILLSDGRTVAVKRIQTKTFSLSKAVREEVKQVRELDHPNLCKFFGGCVEVPNIAIVTEYCPKGSLSDVLLNDDIPLNWGFSTCAYQREIENYYYCKKKMKTSTRISQAGGSGSGEAADKRPLFRAT